MDRKELTTIAASNHYLRGLLAIPVGVVLVASGLGNMEWGPFRNLWVVPACALAAAAGYGLVLRYYNEHYGRVLRQMGVKEVLGSVLVQALGAPLNGIALSWAIVVLCYYGFTVGLRPHHLAIWGTVLAAALLPFWGDARTTNTSNVGLLMLGAAVMLTGILDHRLLVRTFGPSQDPRLEASSAAG